MAPDHRDCEELARELARTRTALENALLELAEARAEQAQLEAAWTRSRQYLARERDALRGELARARHELDGLRQTARVAAARELQRVTELEERVALVESDLRRARGGAA